MKHLSKKKHWSYVKTGHLYHFCVLYHYHQFYFDEVSYIYIALFQKKKTGVEDMEFPVLLKI